MIEVGRDPQRIRDYLAGRLSEEESQAFGERLIRDPQLVRELEQTLRLREGLELVRAQAEFKKSAFQEPGLRAWLPALAVAATLGVLGFSLWLRSGNQVPLLTTALPARLTAAAVPAIAARYTFVPTRGGAAPTLTLPASGTVEFRAATPTPKAAAGYRISLLGDQGTATRETLGAVTVAAGSADADGYLHVYADAARLAPGRYRLQVLDRDGTAAEEMFRFELRAASASP